jgi:hypothetical protein
MNCFLPPNKSRELDMRGFQILLCLRKVLAKQKSLKVVLLDESGQYP